MCLDAGQCNAYFDSVALDDLNDVTPAPPELSRCSDTGFLQLLRVVGPLATLTTAIATTVALVSYTSEQPREPPGKDSADNRRPTLS